MLYKSVERLCEGEFSHECSFIEPPRNENEGVNWAEALAQFDERTAQIARLNVGLYNQFNYNTMQERIRALENQNDELQQLLPSNESIENLTSSRQPRPPKDFYMVIVFMVVVIIGMSIGLGFLLAVDETLITTTQTSTTTTTTTSITTTTTTTTTTTSITITTTSSTITSSFPRFGKIF